MGIFDFLRRRKNEEIEENEDEDEDERDQELWPELHLDEPLPEEPLHPELEETLQRDPASEEAHLVLGDWLQARGHPRGELIALMHRLEQEPHGDVQEVGQKILHLVDDRALIGPLAALQLQDQLWEGRVHQTSHVLRLVWRLGFISEAILAPDLHILGVERAPSSRRALDGLRVLLHLPSARLLESLTLGLVGDFDQGGTGSFAGAIQVLVEAGPRPTLHRLFLGDFEYPEQTEISWTEMGSVAGLWPLYPNLRELILQAGSMSLGSIHLPELRSFEVRTGRLSRASVNSIVQARWPKLERLMVWFDSYGAEATALDLGPLLAAQGLDNLRVLGLMNSELTDAICELLPQSVVVRRLEELDLSLGTMSDAGARALARDRLAFPRLKRLKVRENFLTGRGIEALRSLGVELLGTDDQKKIAGE